MRITQSPSEEVIGIKYHEARIGDANNTIIQDTFSYILPNSWLRQIEL
jgi:hypothetical protein